MKSPQFLENVTHVHKEKLSAEWKNPSFDMRKYRLPCWRAETTPVQLGFMPLSTSSRKAPSPPESVSQSPPMRYLLFWSSRLNLVFEKKKKRTEVSRTSVQPCLLCDRFQTFLISATHQDYADRPGCEKVTLTWCSNPTSGPHWKWRVWGRRWRSTSATAFVVWQSSVRQSPISIVLGSSG